MSLAVLPYDYQTAKITLQDLRKEIQGSHDLFATAMGLLLPMAIGGGIAYWLLPAVITQAQTVSSLLAVSAGVLAYTAILIGFVVTLMLATGKIDRPELLTIEQLQTVVSRVNYLLYSQMVTLFAAVGLAVIVVLWSLLLSSDVLPSLRLWMGVLAGAFMALCFVRTLLLPLQVYELHRFGFHIANEINKVEYRRRRANYSTTAADEDDE